MPLSCRIGTNAHVKTLSLAYQDITYILIHEDRELGRFCFLKSNEPSHDPK